MRLQKLRPRKRVQRRQRRSAVLSTTTEELKTVTETLKQLEASTNAKAIEEAKEQVAAARAEAEAAKEAYSRYGGGARGAGGCGYGGTC